MKIKKIKDSELVQIKSPYQSTLSFEKFLKSNKALNNTTKSVLDLGCGLGAQINYFSKKFPKIKFIGWDYSKKQINKAKKLNKNKNCKFYTQDILNIKKKLNVDLTISIQTFCCFKDSEKLFKSISKINSKWIAINSLFYDGPIDVLIHIRELKKNSLKDNDPDGDFNIHSIPKFEKIIKKEGYKLIKKIPFFPERKIPKPKNGVRGSYTIKTEFNKFTIFSGPVHLPWYFLLLKKINKNNKSDQK